MGGVYKMHHVTVTVFVVVVLKIVSLLVYILSLTFKNSTGVFKGGCAALDMPEWREMIEWRDCWAKQPSQVACISEDLKCWGAWGTTSGHHTTDHLEERGVERGSSWWSSLKGWAWDWEEATVNQMKIGTVSKATLGKLQWDRLEHVWAFSSA